MLTAWAGMGNGYASDLAPSRRDVSRREVSQSPSFMPALAAARRAFGVVTALGVGLIGLLAWRLFGLWPAVLGGALVALDPFFLAHARLVHIDASLTLWATLALLAALVRWYRRRLVEPATGRRLRPGWRCSRSAGLDLAAAGAVAGVVVCGVGVVRTTAGMARSDRLGPHRGRGRTWRSGPRCGWRRLTRSPAS